eukprot:9052728-Pyramimonas_sp.AAC.1
MRDDPPPPGARPGGPRTASLLSSGDEIYTHPLLPGQARPGPRSCAYALLAKPRGRGDGPGKGAVDWYRSRRPIPGSSPASGRSPWAPP